MTFMDDPVWSELEKATKIWSEKFINKETKER